MIRTTPRAATSIRSWLAISVAIAGHLVSSSPPLRGDGGNGGGIEGPPTIVDFLPKEGGVGTEIAIFGAFSSDSGVENYCAAIVSEGGLLIPLDVDRFDDTDGDGRQELVAIVGALPHDVVPEPGPILLSFGRGMRAVPDGVPVESWAWSAIPPGAISREVFRPLPVAGKPVCFFGAPQDGVLTVELPAPTSWQPGTIFEIRLQAFGPEGTPGLALHIPGCVTEDGVDPTAMFCAAIQSALSLVDAVVECSADVVQPAGSPAPVLRLGVANPPGIPQIVQGVLAVGLDRPPLAQPLITGFDPPSATCGTRVTFVGTGFVADPDSVSLTIPYENARVPLEVVEASAERIVAIPPWDDWFAPADVPVIYRVGRGERVFLEPEVPGARLLAPIRLWGGDASGATTRTRQLLHVDPCPKEVIVLATPGPQDDGSLFTSADIDWPLVSTVEVLVHAVGETGSEHSLHASLELSADGAQDRCLVAIASVITQAFSEFGAPVAADVAEDPSGALGLLVRLGNDDIVAGALALGVMPVPSTAPVITDVDPPAAGYGEQVAIIGENFSDDPDDICVDFDLPDGQTSSLSVVSASETQIIAELGPVPCPTDCPEKPHPAWLLHYTLGEGLRQLVPVVEGLAQGGPTWTWQLSPTLPLPPPKAQSPEGFQLLAGAPPDGVEWFFADPPRDGRLCLFLRGDWREGTELELRIKLEDTVQMIANALYAPSLTLEEGGTLLECAEKICAFIEGAFASRDIPVECSAELAADGLAKLTLSIPDGRIDRGHFVVCATAPERPQIVIEDIDPKEGGYGDIITIQGSGFGNDPLDVVAGIRFGDQHAVPLRVESVNDTSIKAVVGAIRPEFSKPVDVKPCPIYVGRGIAFDPPPNPWEPFELADPSENYLSIPPDWPLAGSDAVFVPRTFIGSLASPADGQAAFFNADDPPDGCFYGAWDGESLNTELTDLPADTELKVVFQMLGFDDGAGKPPPCIISVYSPRLRVADDVSAADLARRLVNSLTIVHDSVFDGELALDISGSNRGLVVIASPATFGILDVYVWLPPAGKPVITDVSATTLSTDDVFTIRGRNFGNDPDDLSVSALVDSSGVPMRALSASDTEIRASVGPIPPKPVEPGPIMVVRGAGSTRLVKPVDFVRPAEFKPVDFLKPVDIWAWVGDDAGASFSKPVEFEPVGPIGLAEGDGGGAGAGVVCLYGSLGGGMLTLPVFGDWPGGTEVDLMVRLRGASGNAYQLEATAVLGGGTTTGCAAAILSIVQNGFQILRGVTVHGAVVPQANGTADVELSLPGDPVVQGYFVVCARFGSGGPGLIPGDCNVDGNLDLSDAVCLLGFLFLGNPDELPCGSAGGVEPDPADLELLDAEGGGDLDLTDPIRLLGYLFLGGPPHARGVGCTQISGCPELCVP